MIKQQNQDLKQFKKAINQVLFKKKGKNLYENKKPNKEEKNTEFKLVKK